MYNAIPLCTHMQKYMHTYIYIHTMCVCIHSSEAAYIVIIYM